MVHGGFDTKGFCIRKGGEPTNSLSGSSVRRNIRRRRSFGRESANFFFIICCFRMFQDLFDLSEFINFASCKQTNGARRNNNNKVHRRGRVDSTATATIPPDEVLVAFSAPLTHSSPRPPAARQQPEQMKMH